MSVLPLSYREEELSLLEAMRLGQRIEACRASWQVLQSGQISCCFWVLSCLLSGDGDRKTLEPVLLQARLSSHLLWH
jgi:hypothetical protein